MKASTLNRLIADSRVPLPPKATAGADLDTEIWRGVAVYGEERTIQVSSVGRLRSVDTAALLYGGSLQIRVLDSSPSRERRDTMFKIEGEVYASAD